MLQQTSAWQYFFIFESADNDHDVLLPAVDRPRRRSGLAPDTLNCSNWTYHKSVCFGVFSRSKGLGTNWHVWVLGSVGQIPFVSKEVLWKLPPTALRCSFLSVSSGSLGQMAVGFPQLFSTFVFQSPTRLSVAWIVDISHPHTSIRRKINHVVAVGVFFALIFAFKTFAPNQDPYIPQPPAQVLEKLPPQPLTADQRLDENQRTATKCSLIFGFLLTKTDNVWLLLKRFWSCSPSTSSITCRKNPFGRAAPGKKKGWQPCLLICSAVYLWGFLDPDALTGRRRPKWSSQSGASISMATCLWIGIRQEYDVDRIWSV